MEENILYSRIEGDGKPLLILHGYMGMSDNWKTLSTRYALQGYQVHALDLRNHGRSFHSENFDYQFMIDDLINYMAFHSIDKTSIIGHSMGGKLAMFFACAFPDKVEKLIIADIGPREYRPHHQDILEALNAIDFNIHQDRKTIEEILSQYINDFGTVQFLMKNVYRVTPQQLGFRMNLKVLTEKYDNIGVALPENAIYTKPTLFLKGDRSRYIKDTEHESIKHHFPMAEFTEISNSGHWLHAENPEEFFNASIFFLNN